MALAHRLIKEAKSGDEIVLVDSLSRHGRHIELERVLEHECARLIEVDLERSESLAKLPEPVDRLYHLAARIGVSRTMAAPAQILRMNTLTTMNVFDWFAHHASAEGRLLFASTSEVYSGAKKIDFDLPVPTSEAVPLVMSDLENPRFSYALAKTWGEVYARHLSTETESLFASVRYHNVYGPRMGYDHVIPQIINRVNDAEEPFRIIGAGQTRSFCWIEDAAEATYRTMEAAKLKPGMVVHIGCQEEIAIGDLYELIFKVCQWQPFSREEISPPPGDVSRRCPDTTRLQSLTGYQPSTPLAEGLTKTVRWYTENAR